MKKLQSPFAAVALTLLLSISASAGIMEIGKTQPTPTPAPTSVMTESDTTEADGIIEIGVASSADLVKEIALNLLQSVLTLF